MLQPGLRATVILSYNRRKSDDGDRLRNGPPLAPDWRRRLARLAARPSERPHPAEAGVDRAADRGAAGSVGTTARARGAAVAQRRTGFRIAGPGRRTAQALGVP